MRLIFFFFFFSSRRRHTRYWRDWSSDVCSSDLGEVVPELLLGPGADDDRGDRRLGQRVRQRDLGGRDAVALADLDQHVDRVVEPILVVDRRLGPALEPAGPLRGVLAAAVLAGEQTARERTPHQDAEPLVDG